MKIGEITKTVISKGKRGKRDTQQVVYKTCVGKKKGKPLLHSKTKHEFV